MHRLGKGKAKWPHKSSRCPATNIRRNSIRTSRRGASYESFRAPININQACPVRESRSRTRGGLEERTRERAGKQKRGSKNASFDEKGEASKGG